MRTTQGGGIATAEPEEVVDAAAETGSSPEDGETPRGRRRAREDGDSPEDGGEADPA